MFSLIWGFSEGNDMNTKEGLLGMWWRLEEEKEEVWRIREANGVSIKACYLHVQKWHNKTY